MARIRQEDVDAVRERTDIVAVIQQYVALKKSGRGYAGLCPFHTEKTPSFVVDQAKQLYHCFGCSVGGNVFHFVMGVESLTFPEAAERLARQAGVTLRYEGLSPGDRRAVSRRQALFRANAKAAELYHAMLREGREAEDARRYLRSRGISSEAITEFGIGFAPGYPDFLLRRMARELSPEILVEAGLALKSPDGAVRDRFRARVMFPVHDVAGQPVGFGARLLQGDGPKYVNSPATPVYAKGDTLYNLHRAKARMTESGRAYVVEGYTDVIALNQAGIPAAVATCGTALGEGHFRLLSRFARQVVLAFDSDEAGARAAERAHGFFERYPLEVLVLILPEGRDPADLVAERGSGSFEELAAGAVPLVEYMIGRVLRGRDLGNPESQAAAVRDALPILTALEDRVRRGEYAGLLAELARVRESSVLLELERAESPSRAEEKPAARAVRAPGQEVEKEALKLLIQDPEPNRSRLGRLKDEHFTTEKYRKVLSLLREAPGAPAELVGRIDDERLARLVAALSVEGLKGEPGNEYAERVFFRLEEFFLTRQIDTVKKRLERMNPLKDPADFDPLYEQLITLEGERRRVQARAGEGV